MGTESDAAACSLACSNNGMCEAWNFRGKDGKCQLKSTADAGTHVDSAWQSGLKCSGAPPETTIMASAPATLVTSSAPCTINTGSLFKFHRALVRHGRVIDR